jgi:hypothetical protein
MKWEIILDKNQKLKIKVLEVVIIIIEIIPSN